MQYSKSFLCIWPFVWIALSVFVTVCWKILIISSTNSECISSIYLYLRQWCIFFIALLIFKRYSYFICGNRFYIHRVCCAADRFFISFWNHRNRFPIIIILIFDCKFLRRFKIFSIFIKKQFYDFYFCRLFKFYCIPIRVIWRAITRPTISYVGPVQYPAIYGHGEFKVSVSFIEIIFRFWKLIEQ